MLVQAAAQIAQAEPSANVLVVDLSLYSDTSAYLMGGLERESVLSATRGLDMTTTHTTPDTRAEGLLRDLMAGPETTRSLFGSMFGRSRPVQKLDLINYMVRPSICNQHIPGNLHLIASAAGESWSQERDQNHPDALWWTSNGDEWIPAAERLRDALSQLPGRWYVLMDTDHLAGSPLTKLALASVDETVVPISLDEADFRRMYEDPTGNALFGDVMVPLSQQGLLSGGVTKFVFTKMVSQSNTPVETNFGISSPMKPAAAAQNQMDAIAQAVLEAARLAPELQPCLKGFDSSCTNREFAQRYFSTFKTVSDLALNASKLCGAPLCMMRHDDRSLGSARPDAKVLEALHEEVDELAESILRCPQI